MTTIAYCRQTRTLAADRRCVNGHDSICAPVTKIGRAKDGSLIACAGSVVALQLVTDWLDGDAEGKFDGPARTDIMVVSPDGDVHMVQDGVIYEIQDDFPVLGSGGDHARGAMAAGATAKQAVEIACRFDPFSGDGINTLVLGA